MVVEAARRSIRAAPARCWGAGPSCMRCLRCRGWPGWRSPPSSRWHRKPARLSAWRAAAVAGAVPGRGDAVRCRL